MATDDLLSGVKVLDLSRILAGPLATMMLADMGADVIKVERPGQGDETRGWGPPFDPLGRSAYFLSVNRNKRSIALDLTHAPDRELLLRLVGEADVVVENFLPGALQRLDLDPDALLAAHPQLVWCSITGFGGEAERPGYDFVVQAESGWMAISGDPEGEPMKVGVALADVVAGKDAAIGILGALVGRGRGRRGVRISTSLVASAAAALVNVAQNALVTGEDARRWGNAHPNLVPYQLFHASDRAIVIAVGSDAQWLACARALGLHALADDPRFATNAGRVTHRDVLVAVLSERLRQHSAAEWIQLLDAGGVPCGVVKGVLEALREVACSPEWGVAPSVPGRVRLPPPMLDEHGAEIRRRGWAAFDPGHERSSG
jgi:crotonobetainyl-CoA:carnitine CoA-transferase CaiB-like acyl-CoA transferase